MSPFPSPRAGEASEQAPDAARDTSPTPDGDVSAPFLDGGGADAAAASDEVTFTALDMPALDAGASDASGGTAWMADLPPVFAPTLDGGEVPPPPAPGALPGMGGDAPTVPGDVPPPVPPVVAAPELPTVPGIPTVPGMPPVPDPPLVSGLPAAPPVPGLPTAPPPAPPPVPVPTLPLPPSEPAPVPTIPPAPGPAPVPVLPPPGDPAPIPGLPPLPAAPPIPVLPPPPPSIATPPPGADVPVPPITDAPVAPPLGDVPVAPPGDVPRDVPTSLTVDKEVVVLDSGQEIVVVGGPEKCLDGRHQQGDNTMEAVGDCGLVSSRDVLLQFGVNVSEDEIVRYAVANGLCQYDTTQSPEHRGGSNVIQRVELLHHYGVEAHIEVAGTVQQLAGNIGTGRAVIIGIESDVLWRDGQTPPYVATGQSDHAITVTGVVHDAKTGDILGFTVNDSGSGKFNQFVSADLMQRAWVGAGGTSVVTNGVTVPKTA